MRFRRNRNPMIEEARETERTKRRLARLSMRGARSKILVEANRHSQMRTYTGRSIQQAVFLVRQRRLVDDKVLIAAGYNPNRPRANRDAPPAETKETA